MDIELTPGQLADFDQAFAASEDILIQLVGSYMARRCSDQAEGVPEQLAIMAMAEFLAKEWDEAQLVSALVAAVVSISTAVTMAAQAQQGDD